MSNPVLGRQNVFRLPGIILTTTSEDLSAPVENLLNDSLDEVWSSRHTTIKIDSKCNKLDFKASDVGGGATEMTITIPDGEYHKGEFVDKVVSLLNITLDANGALDNVSGTILQTYGVARFSRASRTMKFLTLTGTNQRTSVFPILGFTCGADSADSGTLYGVRSVFSTGGTFVITSSNKHLVWQTQRGGPGSPVTHSCDMAEGTYNGMSLLNEIKYQMDAADTPIYDPWWPLSRFTFLTGMAATDYLAFPATSNPFADVIGFTANATFAGSPFAHEYRIHTSETISIDLLAATSFNYGVVAFFGSNLTANGTYTINVGATPGAATGTATIEAAEANCLVFTASWSYRYITLILEDRANPDGRIYIGAPYIGSMYEFSDNSQWERSYGAQVIESFDQNRAGDVFGQVTANMQDVEVVLKNMTRADSYELSILCDYAGKTKAFFWCWDKDDSTRIHENTSWSLIDTRPRIIRDATDVAESYHSDTFVLRRVSDPNRTRQYVFDPD